MDCKAIQAQFDERLDERLDSPQRAAFEAHIQACEDCRREWTGYAAAWKVLAQHKALEPSFGFVERVLRRLETPPASWHSLLHSHALRWALLACLVAGVAAGGLTVWHRQQEANRMAAIYAAVNQPNFFEDFDVIASLDQLQPGQNHQ